MQVLSSHPRPTLHECVQCGKCGLLSFLSRASTTFECKYCGSFNTLEKDYTISEWVQNQIDEYREYIVRTTENDKFTALAANSVQEVRQGYLTNEQVGRLRQTMKNAFLTHKTINQLSYSIQKNVGITDLKVKVAPAKNVEGEVIRGSYDAVLPAVYRASMIAKTESVRLTNNARLEMFEDAGVNEAEWNAINDERTCEICQELDGTVYSSDEWYPDMIIEESHPGCRCFLRSLQNE